MNFNDGWVKKIPRYKKRKIESIRSYLARGGKITKCKSHTNVGTLQHIQSKNFLKGSCSIEISVI